MPKLLLISPFLAALLLGLALGVVTMIRGIDRHLERRGHVSPLSMPTVGAFFTLFGAVGYPLARYTSLSVLVVTLIATSSAIAGATGVFALIAGWAVPSAANEQIDPRFLLQGHFGRVTREIALGADGEIAYESDGVQQRVAARALDGKTIPAGAEIVIERIEGGIAHVELWTTIARDLQLPA
jgi:hypothetical protein